MKVDDGGAYKCPQTSLLFLVPNKTSDFRFSEEWHPPSEICNTVLFFSCPPNFGTKALAQAKGQCEVNRKKNKVDFYSNLHFFTGHILIPSG